MRLLLVEDDDQIADFIQQGLRESGYAVDRAPNGKAGLALALYEPYDVAVVDLMLPGLDGLTLIERMRQQGATTPVLILSAKRSVDDRVRGLQAGGDDYLIKPFAFAELLARVQALLRRATVQAEPTTLTAGPVQIDLLTREVTRAGQQINLPPREFSLLEYLMRNANQVVTKTMILQHIWEFEFDPQTNVIDVLVHRLRKKVDSGFEPPLIHTVRGIGYVFRVA